MKRTLALVAAAISLVAAAPAAADSISYIKDGNVWLSTPDGSRQVPLTTSGGYSYASQADDGTVIALYGQRIHRIARNGAITADFATPVSDGDSKVDTHFGGPFTPVVSPDGKKIAYEYLWVLYDPTNPNCHPPTCLETRTEGGIAYSHADRNTPWDEPGFGRQSGWLEPSWIDDEHTLLADKTVRYGNLDLFVDTRGDGPTTSLQWFSDDNSWYMRDPEMTRQKTKVAVLGTAPAPAGEVGNDDDQVRIYRMNGDAPALPDACYVYEQPKGKYRSPSWSPDGAKIAFEDTGQGILVGAVPDFSGGCSLPAKGGDVVIAGGSFPDWGPADVPARGKGPGPDPKPKPNGKRLTLSLAKSAKLGTALKRGLVVTVDGGGPGRASGKALRKGKTLATGSAKAKASGKATLTLRFAKRSIKRLRDASSVRLTVKIAFKPSGGGPASKRSGSVLLKR